MALFLSPILLIVVLLALGEFHCLVGAGVYCLLLEACCYPFKPMRLLMDQRALVCDLPLVTGGFGRAPARAAFLAFTVGYFGFGLANHADAALFACTLLFLLADTAAFCYLGCFPTTGMLARLLATAALSVGVGVAYRYSLQLGAKRAQRGCAAQKK